MTEIITAIIVEVITIFGIATKELKRGSGSEFPIGYLGICTELRPEKFLRKLAGKNDLEDALRRLDRLTQEEARAVLAENLKVAQNVRDEVKVVGGNVERVEDKVEVVGEKVDDVGEKVDDVGEKVDDVGEKVDDIGHNVQCVEEKVQVLIDGTQGMSSRSPIPPNL